MGEHLISSTCIFEKLSQEQFVSQACRSPILLRTPMLVKSPDQGSSRPYSLAISANYVYLFDAEHLLHPPLGHYQIDFDCQFSLAQTNQAPPAEGQEHPKEPSCPFVLHLERTNHGSMDFHGSTIAHYQRWCDVLASNMNQLNFHSLFKPIKKLKQGTFASVYKVKRISDGKMFAAKAFSKEGLYLKKHGKESLINEINIMRQFSDERLLKTHGVFESANSVYVICELMEGQQLDEEMESRQFSHCQTKAIMKNILQGLDVLAAAGVIHRDLKPENIMTKSKGSSEVVIIDFGLSTHSSKSHQLFGRCGTPGYIAPEIINNKCNNPKSNPTTVSDMFSLGLIFHKMLMGKSIFPATTHTELFSQNKACEFSFEHQDYKALTKSSLDLLKAMLQIEPKKRISAKVALAHTYFTEQANTTALVTEMWCSKRTVDNIETAHTFTSSTDPSTPLQPDHSYGAVKRRYNSPLKEQRDLQRKRVKLSTFGEALIDFTLFESPFSH